MVGLPPEFLITPEFLFSLIVLGFNILLAYKKIPIMAFPVGLFSIYFFATAVLGDTESKIPYKPLFTIFALLVIMICMVANALEFRSDNK